MLSNLIEALAFDPGHRVLAYLRYGANKIGLFNLSDNGQLSDLKLFQLDRPIRNISFSNGQLIVCFMNSNVVAFRFSGDREFIATTELDFVNEAVSNYPEAGMQYFLCIVHSASVKIEHQLKHLAGAKEFVRREIALNEERKVLRVYYLLTLFLT